MGDDRISLAVQRRRVVDESILLTADRSHCGVHQPSVDGDAPRVIDHQISCIDDQNLVTGGPSVVSADPDLAAADPCSLSSELNPAVNAAQPSARGVKAQSFCRFSFAIDCGEVGHGRRPPTLKLGSEYFLVPDDGSQSAFSHRRKAL